ncbi:MAG TPA: arsenate reductase (glutaredoxin) [Candidatus Obscuribacterales bacterium]
MRLYHNPRCSKSRATLALLQEKGHQPEVIEYLQQPPSVAELGRICQLLGKKPLELIRTGEDRFKELGLAKSDTRPDSDWLQLMHDNPILIERPILVNEDRAAIGRPPEAVLDIL